MDTEHNSETMDEEPIGDSKPDVSEISESSVETSTDEPDNVTSNRPVISNQVKKRLRKLREYGIDTSKLTLDAAMAMDLGEIRKTTSKVVTRRKRPVAEDTPEPKRFKPSGSKMAIVPAEYPVRVLSFEEAEELKQEMVSKIFEMRDGISPQFEGCRFMNSFLGVICVNEHTIEFVRRVLREYDQGQYKLMDVKDLPPRQKIMVYLPREMKHDLIIQLVERQNPGLSCAHWRILKGFKFDKSYRVVVTVDNQTIEHLEANKWHLWCGLWLVSARKLADRIKSGDGETSQDCDGSDQPADLSATEEAMTAHT